MRLTNETFARRRTPQPRLMAQAPAQPMPLPQLPELKRKEEERRGAAWAVPSMPGAAPVQTAVVGAASGSPVLWFARGVVRAVLRGGLPAGSFPVAAVVLAGMSLGFAYNGLVREEESPALSAAFIPHPAASGGPIRTPDAPPSSYKMVVEEERASAAAASPAAPEPEGPVQVSDEAPAAERSAAVEEPLQDALSPLKPRPARRSGGGQRLAWGGQGIQPLPPLGGEFRPMRDPRAVSAAAKALAARRAGRAASLRGSARLKLGTSRLQGGSAQRAMGQLKLANRLSAASAQAPSAEASRQGGIDAFEQGKTLGGGGLALDAVPSTGLGAGAPDVTESGAPALPEGKNVTPYQDKVDSAKKKNSMTVMMLILGAVLIAAGIILITMPDATATMQNIGYALIGAGTALILAGFLMGQQAKDDGKEVGDKYGQKDQGAVIEDCADQSLGKTDCAPKAVEQPGSTVHEDVEAESKAGYTLGAEGAEGGRG